MLLGTFSDGLVLIEVKSPTQMLEIMDHNQRSWRGVGEKVSENSQKMHASRRKPCALFARLLRRLGPFPAGSATLRVAAMPVLSAGPNAD